MLRTVLFTACLLGVGLHVFISVVKSAGGPNAFSLGLLVWSLLPYASAVGVAALAKNVLVGVVPVCLVLALDTWTYYAVFVHPSASTAALALLAVPLWNLVLVVPIGAGATWFLIRGNKQ